ncbi:hypothetical protein LIZ94_20585, partial [Flavonifractor plautii]|nr:hypothetical protein [Flavonifractor plautii]
DFAVKPNSNCFSLRPATREEASLFYSDDQTDRSLGTVGHVRIDFGSSGKGFYHTWRPHNGEQFNTPKFKEALQQFVDAVREDGPLKDLSSMGKFCRQNGGAITEDGRSYGYLAEMGDYRFCLRCTPSPGEYQCYLYCYDLRQQTLDRPVGRVSFANGEHMEFTAPQDYLRTIREELPTKDGTGFLFETLTDAPAVRKAVDDMVYDLYGEENPRPLEDYVSRQGPEMGGQQM